MAFLSNFFGSKPVPPPRVPTDTVIPLFRLDDTRIMRSMSLEYTMRFDEVLDADKLHDALWKLLEQPGWKKLGARLRLNDKGKLDYHIPAEYNKSRPPVNYTHIVEPMPFSEHPLNTRLPRANGRLEIFNKTTGHLRILTEEECKPLYLDDYIYSDRPQLGLHIKTFDDATLVTITWLHTLLDAMGRSALLRAWTAMLDGRNNDVPDFIGWDIDLLEPLGATAPNSKTEAPEEAHILAPKLVSRLGMLRFTLSYIWELVFHPVEEGRTIMVPVAYFSNLKSTALSDLSSLPESEITYNATTQKPFLSDGDILTAWFSRLLVSVNPRVPASNPNRTVAVMNVFGLRELLRSTEPALLPAGAWIHNCATAIWSHFTREALLTLPLGHVAARLRADLVAQGTRAQMEASARVAREKGGMALYGDAGMALCTVSNWGKARLFEVDFSAAVVKGGEEGNQRRGRPRLIHPYTVVTKGMMFRGGANVVGRDGEGNWWLGCLVRKESIGALVEAVEAAGGLVS